MRNVVGQGQGCLWRPIEFGKGSDDCLFEVLYAAEEVVVEGALLEVSPQPFDGIQLRAILGKPDYQDVVFVLGQQIERGSGPMIGSMVQNQHHGALSLGLQKLAEELVELSSVLLGMDEIMHLPATVVECPIDAKPLVGTGSRHLGAAAAEAPDLGQGGVEINLTLVEEKQVKAVFGLECAFFKKAMISFFSLYSLGSRRCPMT